MTDPRRPSHPALTLAASIAATSLAFIDGSVVNVALPVIGRELHAGAASLQWTIDAYLLPLSALLLLGGAAGDRFGRRRLLIGGTVLFVVASLCCALAPSLPALLAARAVQGVGAAMLMPNSLAALGNAFSGEARGRAIGTWAAAGAITAAIGPPLGGWLIGAVGWRAIFYLNLPVGAAAIFLARRYLRESRAEGGGLDLAGAALATVALGLIAWGLTLASTRHGIDGAGAGLVAAGTAALAAFLLVERRRGEAAMMPFAMFGSAAFAGLTALTFLVYGALGGLMLLLPYVLQQGGYSPLQAGLALLPFPIVVGSASRLTGRMAERTGPRWPLAGGAAVVAIGFALLDRIDPAASYWTSVLPGIGVIAAGMAFVAAPLTSAVLGSVDDAHTGTASGFNSAVSRAGGLIATAVAGAVIASRGGAILAAFHHAALVGAALAAAAAVIGWLTLARHPAEQGS